MGGDSLSVPILYEANATDFNNLGLGPLVDTTVATVTEERNGQFILEMQYPVEGIRSSLITKNRILKVDTGHKLKDQRFVIKRINRIMGNDGLSYSIYAEHISYITADYALKPNLTISGSGNVAMTQWLNGIIDSNRIHVDSDITTENTTSWTIDKVQNARQALGGVQGSILDVWGGEYRFDNLNISLLRHRGTVSNTLLSYGRNITDFDQEENITNTYTSIYPFASYSVQNGDTSVQKILTIPDLVVDSEYVKNFPNRKIQVVDFSDKFSTDEKPTVERLAELAKSYIKNNNVGVPTVSTKISFVDLSKTENYKEFAPLEELDLCDEVPFVFDKFGIKTTAKISRIVWNVLLDSYDSLELGELKTNLSDVINNTNNAALDAKDAANDAKNSADNAALSANGKNRNWYGADDPAFGHLSELREGDSWYMPNGEDTELYHWINGQWVFILSTKDAHEAKDAADKASKEAEEAKKQANKAVDGANDAVAKAGFANDTATQAKSDAAAAGQQAKDALTNAGTALTNAKTALDNVTKLDQTVKTEVTNINGQLSQKVNQTTFDTLKGTVTSQGTLINQNKDAIKLKADQTYVDTIKGTVANNTAAIDLNSKEIKLKANQSTVDSLNGTVKNLDAEQKIQAGQIAQTVSKTELTSKLNSYATQTWTQSQIKSTADSINLNVSKVQTNLDNLKIGGTNLIQNSGFENAEAKDFERIKASASYPTPFGEYMARIHFSNGAVNTDFDKYWTLPAPITIEANVEYTMSYYYSAAGSAIGQASDFAYNGDTVIMGLMMAHESHDNSGGQGVWKRFVRTFKLANETTITRLRIGFVTNSGNTGWKVVDNFQLEKGNKVSDHSPSPSDYASDVEFSNLEVKVNGVQTTVATKADQSQVTQMASQITSLVGSTNNANLIPNSGLPKDTLFWRTNDTTRFKVATHSFYTKGSLFALLAPQGTAERTAGTATVSVTRGATYTVSLGVFGESAVVGCDVLWLGRKHGETTDTKVLLLADNFKPNPSKIELKSWAFNVGDCDEGYIRVDNNGSTSGESTLYFGEVKLEKGGRYTPWEQTAESSEIVQTREMINLRVQKGDVINQINISPESILIAGQKVHITGQTSIDNAVIKDAMIANVKADKITAGTINGANVNVINLNANNITTGTIRGANLSMNLNTGEVVFQHGRIHSANNNVDVNIDQGYLSVANDDTRVLLKRGGIQFIQPNLFDHQTSPYLDISNTNSAQGVFQGASIVARDFLSLANSANNIGVFDMPLGVETFAGISFGFSSGGRPTKVGGADRGVVISGGQQMSAEASMYKDSPSIVVGSSPNGGAIPGGNNITITGERVYVPSIYKKTSSGSANVVVGTYGELLRSTSASKYKTDIVRTNTTDYGDKLLNLPTATWTDIAETKRYRDDPANQIKPTRNFGMIAEDLAEAGLEMLVVRGIDGELEGINYDRIGPALIPVIAKLKNEVEILKQKLEEKTA